MTKPDILLVMVAYKNREMTREAVGYALNQSVPVHLVVWDNNSGDGTAEWLQSEIAGRPNVDVICSPENVLWTPAINAGIDRFYDGETFVGWMNNDVNIPPMACERLLAHLNRDARIGVIGPQGSCMGGDHDYAAHWGVWHEGLIRGARWDFELQERIKDRPLRFPTSVSGTFLLSRKETYDWVGGLDNTIPLACDDYEFSLRLREAGFLCAVAQDVYMLHRGHVTGDEPEWSQNMDPGWARCREKWGHHAIDGLHTKGNLHRPRMFVLGGPDCPPDAINLDPVYGEGLRFRRTVLDGIPIEDKTLEYIHVPYTPCDAEKAELLRVLKRHGVLEVES